MISQSRRWAGFALVLLFLIACQPLQLVSDYDEFTDQTVAQLQRRVETLLTTLERTPEMPACSYTQNEDAYLAMAIDLNILIARNKTRPRNGLTNKQLALLKDNLAAMEELHKEEGAEQCLSGENIALLRSGLEIGFNAIVTLEGAKKRGEAEVN